MTENLFNTGDIIRATQNNKKKFDPKGFLKRMEELNSFNKFYEKNMDKNFQEFIDAFLDTFEIKFEFQKEELARIPKQGKCITVSNHPMGGLEAVLLLKILSQVRTDIKICSNAYLKKLKPLDTHLIEFKNNTVVEKSNDDACELSAAMENNQLVSIFPAGEAYTYTIMPNGIMDKNWKLETVNYIKSFDAPIVPIYFQGLNSKLYYFLSLIHPKIGKLKLPSEIKNKKKQTIIVRIGNPITVKEQKEFTDNKKFCRYLRARTYALGSSLDVKKFFVERQAIENAETIAPAKSLFEVKKEIDFLKEKYLLFNSGNFSVICAPSIEMPVINWPFERNNISSGWRRYQQSN